MLKGKLAPPAFLHRWHGDARARASEKRSVQAVTIAFAGFFDRRKTGSFKLVHRYTICYSAKCDDGEGHERAGKVAAIPGGTLRKQCPAPRFRYARPSDERVLQRRHRRTRCL